MKCEIIKDLLPSYIDVLTSDESIAEIEEHLKNCHKCKEVLNQMKTDVDIQIIEYNKEKIKPFKKLNKRVLQSVLITLTVCILVVSSYFYFFGIGWKVKSTYMNITYSYKDDVLLIEFVLTDGKVLNHWSNPDKLNTIIKFTECFRSVLDDRGEYPNQFSYGIHCTDENGNIKIFADDECVILNFKDKTETLYLKEIAKELGLQLQSQSGKVIKLTAYS